MVQKWRLPFKTISIFIMPHCHFGICPSGRMLLQTLLTFVLLPDSDISAPRSALLRIDPHVRKCFHRYDSFSTKTDLRSDCVPGRILHITFPYNVVTRTSPPKTAVVNGIFTFVYKSCPFLSYPGLSPTFTFRRRSPASPHCFPAFLFHGVLHFFLFQCPPVYEPAEIVCFLCRPDSGDESLYHIQMQLLQK